MSDRKFDAVRAAALADEYTAGGTLAGLSVKYSASVPCIRRTLHRVGCQIRKAGPAPVDGGSARARDRAARKARGEQHGMWKGGRPVTQGGYVLQWVSVDDPLAVMRGSAGYVLDHRLVVARSLGRPLLSTETVHHINGDKRDNRIENLQLRHGQHGNGQVFQCSSCASVDVKMVPIAT